MTEKKTENRTGGPSGLAEAAQNLEDASRMARETKGLTALVGRAVAELYMRIAGPEWVERLRRREEAKTLIMEAQAENEQANASNRVRAGLAADTRQKRDALKAEQEQEGFEAQKVERRQNEKERDIELGERQADLVDRQLDQERDEFRIRVCNDMADVLFGALHRARREGRLELSPDQIMALVNDASQRAVSAIECSADRRIALAAN